MDLLPQEMCADHVLTRTELPKQKLCARRYNNWVKKPNNTEYVIQVVYPAMKLILVFAFVFSLGVLTLLAESIPRQEDSQALVSKQDDHSVNYRSDSQNRLKRGTHSGLLNNHWSFDLLGDLLSRSSDAVVRLAHIFRGRARLSYSPTVPVLKLIISLTSVVVFSLRWLS